MPIASTEPAPTTLIRKSGVTFDIILQRAAETSGSAVSAVIFITSVSPTAAIVKQFLIEAAEILSSPFSSFIEKHFESLSLSNSAKSSEPTFSITASSCITAIYVLTSDFEAFKSLRLTPSVSVTELLFFTYIDVYD